MEEILKKLVALLTAYFTKKQAYEWKFYSLDGSEENKQISIANSIEYEFVNSGNSFVIINDNLKLFPEFMGIEPTRVKFTTNKNEVDVGVYEYRFVEITKNDFRQGFVSAGGNFAWTLIDTDTLTPAPPFNKLQVIVKQVSRQ